MAAIKDDAKSLLVVFERKHTVDPDYDSERARKKKADMRNKEMEKNKKELQKKIDAMRLEQLKTYEKKQIFNFNSLIESIQDCNAQEDAATDKFVDNVECMMFQFNNNLDKLQKIYSNVMKNLPKV